VIDQVLAYWFGGDHAENYKKWFQGGPEVDAEIRASFLSVVEQARAGTLDGWGATPRGALAWLILVDQFSRNLYRNSPAAFSCDPMALAWTRKHLAAFEQLSTAEMLFGLLPFEHAEDLDAQREGVARMTKLALRDPEGFERLKGAMDFARKHLDVIARFGRFPHRNETLGRTSTPEELDYLAYGKQTKQWL
jgi:uncharacterized protein (DUF924 family)